MNKEEKTKQLEEPTKKQRIEELVGNLKDKKFKFIFFTPDTEGVPSASVMEIYFHAYTLMKAGYNVVMVTEKKDYKVPEYLDECYREIKHTSTEEKSLKTSADDFIIVPEYFSNVMKQVENLPSEKIILAQAFNYVINSLLPGMRWVDFKFKNVITTSTKMNDFITSHHGNVYDIQNYDIGIPDYFKPSKFKNISIALVTRNPSDAKRIINSFYLKHPELRWVSFEHLYNYSRKEFAEKLSKSLCCVWIDADAGFGTTPLEAMRCKTVPIGLIPNIQQDYVVDNSGAWAENIWEIPDMISQVIKVYMEDAPNRVEHKKENEESTFVNDGEIMDVLYDTMEEVSSKYTQENSKNQILDVYNHFVEKRINEFNIYLETNNLGNTQNKLEVVK